MELHKSVQGGAECGRGSDVASVHDGLSERGEDSSSNSWGKKTAYLSIIVIRNNIC